MNVIKRVWKAIINKPEPVKAPVNEPRFHPLSTDVDINDVVSISEYVNNRTFLGQTPDKLVAVDGFANDSISSGINGTLGAFSISSSINDVLMAWYANQGFIGFQTCAMLAQNPIIDKVCTVPAMDAVRNGFEIAANDGQQIEQEVFAEINKRCQQFKLSRKLIEYVRFGRIFGIRVAMFKVATTDGKYYEKPFNIESVTPYSYKGFVQIDPYWCVPQLDHMSAIDATSDTFYVPTWWQVNGKRVHHTHLVIMTLNEVADVLKPAYQFAGVSIPQRIYQRVYCAERTANEAPQLAIAKRSIVYKMNLSKGEANPIGLRQKLSRVTDNQNNFGIWTVGTDESVEHNDTSLSDFDEVIMTQYQLVAALGGIMGTKLLETSPKGFNATGEYEESSYHESLESIQEHDLTPLVERHMRMLIKSEIFPKHKVTFEPVVVWNSLDSQTAKEKAEIAYIKAQTDEILVGVGAVDGIDVQARVAKDKDSGYDGLETQDSQDPVTDDSEIKLPPQINNAVTNMTGTQHIQLKRIMREFSNEVLNEQQATQLLKTGFGFGDDEIKALLGLNEPAQEAA